MSTPQYELVVRQSPRQSRLAGISNKADRRPLDPVPIIQLRVNSPAGPVSQRGHPHGQVARTLDGQDGRRDHYTSDQTRQNASRYSASVEAGASTTSYRYSPEGEAIPYHDPNARKDSLTGEQPTQLPMYFMYACLASPTNEEIHFLKDGKTRCTSGALVSSLYHLKDAEANNEDAGFFVFPDISIRLEGSFRLKLSLFEVAGPRVRHCKSIFTDPFFVYSPKKFPGMTESSSLSRSLAEQGIRLRIRKEPRVSKKRQLPAESVGPADDDRSGSPQPSPTLANADMPSASPVDDQPQNKRSRGNPDVYPSSSPEVAIASPRRVQPERATWESLIPDRRASYYADPPQPQPYLQPSRDVTPRPNIGPNPQGGYNYRSSHEDQASPPAPSLLYKQPASSGRGIPPQLPPIQTTDRRTPQTSYHQESQQQQQQPQAYRGAYAPPPQQSAQSPQYRTNPSYNQPYTHEPQPTSSSGYYAPPTNYEPSAYPTHTQYQQQQQLPSYAPPYTSHPNPATESNWGTTTPLADSWSTRDDAGRHSGRIELPPLRGPAQAPSYNPTRQGPGNQSARPRSWVDSDPQQHR